MFALFHIDAIAYLCEEDCDCSLIVGLLKRLRLEPYSEWRASQLGSEEFFGFTPERSLLTDISEFTWTGVQASAMNKVKHKPIYERPQPKRPKRIISTRDLASSPDVHVIKQP